LNIGLKHEPTVGDAPGPERRMPPIFANDLMLFANGGFDDK